MKERWTPGNGGTEDQGAGGAEEAEARETRETEDQGREEAREN